MIRSEKDYYAVLGINSKSSQEDIKKAFKKLALKCHPDHHPDDPKAEERFKDINEAYGVLSSPDKRKQYDLFQSYGGNSSQYKYSVDPSGGLNVNFGFDVFENAFDFIFRQNKRRNDPMMGKNLSVPMSVTLYELLCGTEKKFKFSFEDFCSTCRGTGFSDMRDCVPCQGVGIVAQKVNQKVFRYTCRACRGTGEVPDTECGECESRGKVTRVIEDVVKLEPNSRPEKKFIFSNKGGQGLNGGPRGNLIIWLDVSFPNVEDLTDEDKEHLKRICQKS